MMEIILIVMGIIICTILPIGVKNHFENKYNTDILMLGPIALNFVALLSVLVMNLNGMDEMIAIIFAIIVYLFTGLYVVKKTSNICTEVIDIVLAVVANALLPIGIVLIVVMALAALYSSSGGKKKRK